MANGHFYLALTGGTMATEKPLLCADTWEEISRKAYGVKKSWAKSLTPLLQDLPSILDRISGYSDGLPPPPKQPLFLCQILASYASELFDVEASYYSKSDELAMWLHNLAERIEREVISHAIRLGVRPSGLALRSMIGLEYHASKEKMIEAIRNALKSKIDGFKPPRAPALVQTANPRASPPSDEAVKPVDGKAERIALRDLYFAAFQEQIVILDACWAASQHYSELKRWLRGPAIMKDGSTPDLAFRMLFSSRKLPREYKKQPRPSGWK